MGVVRQPWTPGEAAAAAAAAAAATAVAGMPVAAVAAAGTLGGVAAARVATVPARRLGNRWEFGQACAFLCSEQASYLTGQNILIDGGAYPGTF